MAWTAPKSDRCEKVGLTETPEKEDYCLLAICYYTYEGNDACLHRGNCCANVDWSQQGGSEIGFICEQEANLLENDFW